MNDRRSRAVWFAVAVPIFLFAVFGIATSAQAAARIPFTITQTATGTSPTGGGMGTFVATASLCPSGTWVDVVHNTGPNSPNSNSPAPRFYLLVRTVFTCDDGTDSFFGQSHVFVTETGGVFTSTGPSLLQGGTGAFVDLQGTGEDNGNFSTSTGIISGFITGL